MTIGITQDDILTWTREQFEAVTAEGGLTIVRAVRFSANGQDVPIHTMASVTAAAKWTAEKVAETMGYVCDRDARGLPGVNQYELQAMYGTSTKPAAWLPFQRVGQLQYGPLPGGGLATEAASPVGITQLAMRWGEVTLQGANAKDQLITGLLGRLLESERADKQEVMKENREVMGLLRQFIADSMSNKAAMLAYSRNTALIMKAVDAAPLALNQLSGKTILPESMEEDAVTDILLDSLTPQQLVDHIKMVEAKSPTRAALLASKLAQAKKRKAARAAALRDVDADVGEASVEDDLVDRGVAVVRGTNGKSNGETNGHAAAPASAEPEIDAAIDKKQVHGLPKPKARLFVDAMAGKLSEKLPLTCEWQGDRLVVQAKDGPGKGIVGWIDVDETDLRIRVALPNFAHRLFRSVIEGELDEALDRLKAHATGTT